MLRYLIPKWIHRRLVRHQQTSRRRVDTNVIEQKHQAYPSSPLVEDSSQKKIYWNRKPLGSGSFAFCFLVCDHQTGVERVIKRFKPTTPRFLIKNEILIHSKLNHKNICQYISHFKNHVGQSHLILEYCECLTLRDLLDRRGFLSEVETAHILRQILVGLDYIHSKLIVHHDIKLKNIFLDLDNLSGNLIAKIGDFGLAQNLNVNIQSSQFCRGTLRYLAPEKLYRKTLQQNSNTLHICDTFAIDIWSIGVIVFKCLLGRYPFDGDSHRDIVSRIRSLQFDLPTNCLSNHARDLLCKIFVKSPQARPSARQLLSHAFLRTNGQCPCPPRLTEYATCITGKKFPTVENYRSTCNQKPTSNSFWKHTKDI